MSSLHFAYAEQPGLVSVVIPTHRGERFIAAALETIAEQTYDHWEVIVVEDGSHSRNVGFAASPTAVPHQC